MTRAEPPAMRADKRAVHTCNELAAFVCQLRDVLRGATVWKLFRVAGLLVSPPLHCRAFAIEFPVAHAERAVINHSDVACHVMRQRHQRAGATCTLAACSGMRMCGCVQLQCARAGALWKQVHCVRTP